MQNVSDLYNFINFIADKNRRGYLSPEEISQALSSAQVDLWNYYWGLPQTAQSLKGGAPNPDYGSSQLTIDALSPFRARTQVTPGPEGIIYLYNNSVSYQIPNFGHFIGMFKIKTANNEISGIDQYLNSEIVETLKSTLYPVTADNQVFVFENDLIQLYPRVQMPAGYKAEVHYISLPNDVVINYNVTGNTITIINNTNPNLGQYSVQPQFDSTYWVELVARALPYVGVNLSAQEVQALANQQIQSV
jgi:hypothetical protein